MEPFGVQCAPPVVNDKPPISSLFFSFYSYLLNRFFFFFSVFIFDEFNVVLGSVVLLRLILQFLYFQFYHRCDDDIFGVNECT